MDAVTISQRLAFVEQQLNSYAGAKQIASAGSTFVCCPYHSERTPSFRIFHSSSSRAPGYGKCYGCGKKARWDDFAPKLGLQPFKAGPPKDEYAVDLIPARKPEREFEGGFLNEKQRAIKKIPKDKFWREIPTRLLRAIGAHTAEFRAVPAEGDPYWTSRRLYLPVYIHGELRGYIKARLRKHEKYASYINASGPWSRTHGLFPFDYALKLMKRIDSQTIVLVEGQRDALRLLAMGIPAMCILGTQSWSDNKCRLLELGGVKRVVLFMDGDCAGIEATEKIEPTLQSMFEVRVLKLWKMKGSPWLDFQHKDEPSKAAKKAGVTLWDPGNVPQRILEKLKSKFF